MTQSVIITTAILAGLAIIKTNLLQAIAIGGVTPDLVLIVLTYYAQKTGSMPGQLAGFGAGIVEDLLSVSPLGFHALVRTIIGFLAGLTHNKMFLDPIFMPIIAVLVVTLFKGVIASLTGSIFGIDSVRASLVSSRFLIELAYNSLLAPLLFALLGLIGPLHRTERTSSL